MSLRRTLVPLIVGCLLTLSCGEEIPESGGAWYEDVGGEPEAPAEWNAPLSAHLEAVPVERLLASFPADVASPFFFLAAPTALPMMEARTPAKIMMSPRSMHSMVRQRGDSGAASAADGTSH